MSEGDELLIKNSNSMDEIRKAAVKNPGLKDAFTDCMQPVMCLLTEVTRRLKLKDEPIQIQTPCTEEEIDNLWGEIKKIDSSVEKTDSQQAKTEDP